MKFLLTKLSSPDWEKKFNTEEEALKELLTWQCKGCITLIESGEDLQDTSCSAEFLLEEIDV